MVCCGVTGGKSVDMGEIVYTTTLERRTDISSREVVSILQRRDPSFRPAAYLNGTEKPDSFKWLLALRVGDGRTEARDGGTLRGDRGAR